MQLTTEQYEQLPDFIKSEYVQDGDTYVHGGVKKLKGSLDALDGKLKETSTKLSAYEQKQQELQAEAERKALEKLKADGKVDEILADAERRIGETQKQYEERINRMANAIKTEKRNAIVSDLASELATDTGSTAFKKLIASRIDVDPETGKVTFLNDDGSASSLDMAGFKAELLKDSTYSALLKANIATTGGGFVNGGSNNGRTMSNKANLAGNKADRLGAIGAMFPNLPRK